VIVLALTVITTAAAMLLSSLYVRFRDVQIIWSVLVTTIFYATPILYPLEVVHGAVRTCILLNPLTPLFVQARHWIIDPNAPSAVSAAGGWLDLLPSIAIFVAICVAAVLYFNRAAPRIAEEL
jgi:ABC-2 type transport system permease protein